MIVTPTYITELNEEYLGHSLGVYKLGLLKEPLPAWQYPKLGNYWEVGEISAYSPLEVIDLAKLYLGFLVPMRVAARLEGKMQHYFIDKTFVMAQRKVQEIMDGK